MEMVENLKQNKRNLNMDELFGYVALIQESFSTIQSNKLFTKSKKSKLRMAHDLK